MPSCPKCHSQLPTSGLSGMCPCCLMLEGASLAANALGRTGNFLPPEPGEIDLIFPDFEIQALIGRGGMGAVYRAREIKNDRLVAIKILPPDIAGEPDLLERFHTEAATLAELDHPNIVSLYDSGEREDYAYFVMEFIDGMDLSQRLRQQPRLTPTEARDIVRQLCLALEYSHSRDVIHRDIKPANLLLAEDGTVKVADFGLAKLRLPGDSEMGLTVSRAVMGTMHYMAPELSTGSGKVDHRSDVYAAGVILYEMLTGHIPAGRFQMPSERVAGLNRSVDAVVSRALSAEPDQRYQSASAVDSAFTKALATPSSFTKYLIAAGIIGSLLLGILAWAPWETPPEVALTKPLPRPVSGTVLVTQLSGGNTPEEINVALSETTTPGVRADTEQSNRGDYWIYLPSENATTTGTLITTIAETQRMNIFKGTRPGSFHATSSFTTAGYDPRHSIDVHRVASKEEFNVNTSFAWFSFSEFIAGEAHTIGDAHVFAAVLGSEGISLGEQVILTGEPGVTKIDLRELDATSQNGILLANVAENTDCFAVVSAEDDGTFTVFTPDNDFPDPPLRAVNISFVHVPFSDAGKGKVVALGRVRGDASSSNFAGEFTLSKGDPGQCFLSFDHPGTLLLTPADSGKFISCEWSATRGSYLIESRDLKSRLRKDSPFNFVFLAP